MLVLSRKIGEQVVVGDSIRMMVIEVCGNRVQLCFEAPPEGRIHVEETNGKMADEVTGLLAAELDPC